MRQGWRERKREKERKKERERAAANNSGLNLFYVEKRNARREEERNKRTGKTGRRKRENGKKKKVKRDSGWLLYLDVWIERCETDMPGAVVSLPRFNSNDRTVTRDASPCSSCPLSLVSVRVLSRRFIVRCGEIISPLRNVSEIEGKVAIKSSLLPRTSWQLKLPLETYYEYQVLEHSIRKFKANDVIYKF